MPKAPSKPKKLEMLLMDGSAPLSMRLELLTQLTHAQDEAAVPILTQLLEAGAAGKGDEQVKEKLSELAELLNAMKAAPLRCALFDQMLVEPGLNQRAQVILSDGSLASPLVPDKALVDRMRCGDTVWIEAKGGALLFHAPTVNVVGEEARLERVLADGYVTASVGEHSRGLYRPTARLREQIESGEAEAGATLILCPRRMVAFLALPEPDGLEHYKYLCREVVPDVVVERDIGCPPPFLRQLRDHARHVLERPGISDRYRLRRSKLTLLSGIPGSGKSHSINGLWNALYSLMSELTGVPVDELPPRVMRLKSSEVLSKWLGESDRQIARFFKELDQLAAESFTDKSGREWQLPVLVIAEEIDALARSRGEDAIHDRLLATLLEGLDPMRPVFRERLVFVVATTNTSHLVDMAMIRRIGGRIERFGHMDRFSFRSVLEKLLRDLPFQTQAADENAAEACEGTQASCQQAIADTTAWLYAPGSTADGQVELTFVGQANPVTKYHRHFLTAGLIDRAVQEACEAAANAEHESGAEAGLQLREITNAIHRQVRHIVDLLTPQNCDKYLELPDGERVAAVRRIDQPHILPFALMQVEARDPERASAARR